MSDNKPKKLIFLEKVLRWMSVLVLKKYKPRIVSITGSVGKTSTKEAVYTVLSSKFKVRKNVKNYNNEIGVPLTIIGAESGYRSAFKWMEVFLEWLFMMIFRFDYPQVLVLEMGSDRPGAIKYLTDFISSEAGIITDISSSHIEFFSRISAIAKEKGTLVKELDEKGLAVLNADNPHVAKLAEQTKANVITFGFSEKADMRATDAVFVYNGETGKEIRGISFKLTYKGTVIPVRLVNILAHHQIYAALAAATIGVWFDMNLVEIGTALEKFCAPAGRMNLLKGIKNTLIFDDTYNASPISTFAALDMLGKISASRKIAVLGDMLELGEETEKGHVSAARKFLEVRGDIFFAVGSRMRFAVAELERHNFPKENIFSFDNPMDAGEKLQEVMRPGDLVLIKGSQGMRMEKIVEEVMFEPQKASELLCRQNEEWREKPFKIV